MTNHLTIGEVARLYGLPQWKIRRAVDALDAEIPRAAQYRLVPRELLGVLAVELQRRKYLPGQKAVTA